MTKDLELTSTATMMAKNIQSFVVVVIDQNGHAQMSANGNALELCYMEKSLQIFVQKVINGEIKNN